MRIIIGPATNISVIKSTKNNPDYALKKTKKEDRRKNKQDRRKSVRDGVIVSLSHKKERRVRKDRRRKITS